MKLANGILTLAVTMALAACATDNMASHDTTGTAAADRSNDSSQPSGISQANIDAIHAALPDNPQLGGGNDKNVGQGLSDTDRKFIVAAMQGGQFEVSSGEKAATHTNSAGIQALAQYIVYDHTKANGQLENLASRRGFRVPVGISIEQIDKLAQLDKLNGADFDAEFLRQQRQAHEDAVALFAAASTGANDSVIRDWALTTLPSLRNHLDMINAMRGDTNNVGMNDNPGMSK